MKIVQEDLTISTRQRSEMIDITGRVSSIVKKAAITSGHVIVYCPHTTAAITINENADATVQADILMKLAELIPRSQQGYRHFEGNSDAHCKSSLIGCSEQVLVRGGVLQLGSWQGIFFCEFDGPRSRKVWVQVQGQ